ncbi:alpha-1,6-mannosyl-glycoprotein 2-beta-N-acetylglucosaminyltransferase isoform X1 [Apis mellifera]|uniref:Alpha-1,6-mannosyl-glycoprotein 2-beta-N-acetylglucosaminyltransferase n=1 Tax=Apis mellifera TaxID=7460 RepID=A0A7M7GRY9_APIME|nr:alpha-1,6-mannosyl-glycoprotein 2-beta-N-acetylglucosaminyltransferase isoform X1 [Apis mellifera]XP_006563637.2 alpha-1,6-mannosyl-glycoprotein 2-beta-N-acetylglucosaminyltransferase isoform X1 [Apis mellifera]XP_006563638.2 alpha-1,6-mannosyl-glycoprotein 2-beta-N-acetylglucosaminyltransferase isoform X1 [Apis mellifera]XP_006563639.2 alpha-1,6-mannosyl-glycoprotein 2-beta-N-acetylglucosaminyltransferase isoform X1 [Apis mellifera]XP_006563640.2 alpha-1,6-mannosyl-glycoprotein 2-beta-N-ace|eukprot:XP_006563636.2 alpha-1,6-mannosyl-glycoprotein 2-beta-N-acetylglucosaminyltransferase isoform X1 [Apis mellifera]
MRGAAFLGTIRSVRGTFLRTLVFVFMATFLWLQIHVISLTGRDSAGQASSNETLFALVPQELHRFLKDRRNGSSSTLMNASTEVLTEFEIAETRRNMERANNEQRVYNEESFGPLASDAPIIVIQVHTRLTYLRHLIVSLAQAKGIEQTLLVFSHDVWHPDINYLVQSVDFCRVMQIFYPHSIQTHPRSFPGEDPNDCPRNIRKEQALSLGCINAKHPDLYGHYREAKFTQTKHHWWWKANRVFDQLSITKNHTGMVLFLEEDHYVAEDFLHVLRLMERTCKHTCKRCNVLSLGTYLKTYNYFADFSRKFLGVNSALQKELLRGLKRWETSTRQHSAKAEDIVGSGGGKTGAFPSTSSSSSAGSSSGGGGGSGGGSTSNSTPTGTNNGRNNTVTGNSINSSTGASSFVSVARNVQTMQSASAWAFQLLPELYNHYQKAEVIPWISSKHNMGMAFNRVTWNKLRKCAAQFCSYDDYNWDWSLQHIAQTCLPPSKGPGIAPRTESGLITMMMRAPRVFHIGECLYELNFVNASGVHHKKTNCESTAVIAKVQNILKAAQEHLFPTQLTLTVAGTAKKTKLRKGNGGWGDTRDHRLCWNITVYPDLVLP